MAEPLIINGFDRGIGNSPHKGFGLMRLADIVSFPGALKSTIKPASLFHIAVSSEFTADAGTDIITYDGGISTAIGVTLTTTGTLPAGLSTGTIYYVISVTGTTIKLATTIANANASTAINITDAGSGTHTIATVNPTSIYHILRNPYTDVLFFKESTRVWYYDGTGIAAKVLDGNTIAGIGEGGLALLRTSDDSATYLFSFNDTNIEVINVHTTADLETPVWNTGWQSLKQGDSGSRHHAITGQDGIIYYGDGRYVGSIQENAGSVFDPATSATYTFNDNALDLPAGEVAEHLEELGTKLLVAGSTFNKIYPWDRVSDSYDLPLVVPEKNVKRLKNVGNTIYILAGTEGNIYTTQGSFVSHKKKVPKQVIDNVGEPTANPVTWGGVESYRGAFLFGMGVQTSGNSGAYLLYPDGRLTMDQIPTSGGSPTSTNVLSFENKGDGKYNFGSVNGVDSVGTSVRYRSLDTLVQSLFYKVATKVEKATYSTLEVLIAKPASNGQIRVGYREDTSSSFTTLDTYSADGSTVLFTTDNIGLIDIENIQIQAEIDRDIELLEIRLIP